MFKVIKKNPYTVFAVVIYNSSLLRMVSLLKNITRPKAVFVKWVWDI